MIKIGKSKILHSEGMSRLCADITLDGHRTTLWFAVASAQEDGLGSGRADPFAVALLPAAMRDGHELICEDPLSGCLYRQLKDSLIPSLTSVGEWYRPVVIDAPLTDIPYPNIGAVGTGFSGGVDSLYTVYRHGRDCEYPLTHLAVFNSGVFEGEDYRDCFDSACDAAARFAQECGLKTVFLDTNLYEALPERFLDVYTFRNLACALALQGLFSVYLLSSGHDIANFRFDLHNSASYDPLTVSCASTESLTFYLSGMEVKRWQKLEALSGWEPSWNWLHPCIYGTAGKLNCGHCKKCARDATTLYALGALDRYAAVFDTKEYRRNMAARMGFVLANRGNHLYDETLALMDARGVPVPQAAYLYEKQFRRAMENLQVFREGGGMNLCAAMEVVKEEKR